MAGPARYSARLSPILAETVWTLEDGVLIEQRGKSRVLHPLSGLTRATLMPAQARRAHPSLSLRFGLRRALIPSAGFSVRGVEDRGPAFSAFARALCAQAVEAAPSASFVLGAGADRRGPLVWAIVLLGVGVIGMLLSSISEVTRVLGVSLAARLAFAALLLGAALPWLEATDRRFDPRAVPDALLPR